MQDDIQLSLKNQQILNNCLLQHSVFQLQFPQQEESRNMGSI